MLNCRKDTELCAYDNLFQAPFFDMSTKMGGIFWSNRFHILAKKKPAAAQTSDNVEGLLGHHTTHMRSRSRTAGKG